MRETKVCSVDADELVLDHVVEFYDSVGWTACVENPRTLRAALLGSAHVVVARDGDRLVGLARVISDGASICYLQDVLVHPDRQRNGLGRELVAAALAPYADVRQKMLLTDDQPGQEAFYVSLGYVRVDEFGDGSLRAFVRFDT